MSKTTAASIVRSAIAMEGRLARSGAPDLCGTLRNDRMRLQTTIKNGGSFERLAAECERLMSMYRAHC